jgi:hypothetical protein
LDDVARRLMGGFLGLVEPSDVVAFCWRRSIADVMEPVVASASSTLLFSGCRDAALTIARGLHGSLRASARRIRA